MLNPRTSKRSSGKAREMKNRSTEGFDSYKHVKKYVKIYISISYVFFLYKIKILYCIEKIRFFFFLEKVVKMKFFLFFILLANEIKKEKLISKHASILKIKGSNGRNKPRISF